LTIDNRSGCKVNMALLNDQLSQLNQFYQDQCDLQSQLKNGDDEFKRLNQFCFQNSKKVNSF